MTILHKLASTGVVNMPMDGGFIVVNQYTSLCGLLFESEGPLTIIDSKVTCPECINGVANKIGQAEANIAIEATENGVWIVYGHDTIDYPMFVSDQEIEALRYVSHMVNMHPQIRFWKFGEEWGT